MKAREFLYGKLKNNSTVNRKVGANIHFGARPYEEEISLPLIIINRLGYSPSVGKYPSVTYRLSYWSLNEFDTEDFGEKLFEILKSFKESGFRGGVENLSFSSDPNTKTFGAHLTVKIIEKNNL